MGRQLTILTRWLVAIDSLKNFPSLQDGDCQNEWQKLGSGPMEGFGLGKAEGSDFKVIIMIL